MTTTKPYSLELIRNGELVDNSATYYKTEYELLQAAKAALLEDNEKLYVTVLEDGTWFYDIELTAQANATTKR